MKLHGIGETTAGDLDIEIAGPIVRIYAGSGYETGVTYLTPGQARRAAAELLALADRADQADAVTVGQLPDAIDQAARVAAMGKR